MFHYCACGASIVHKQMRQGIVLILGNLYSGPKQIETQFHCESSFRVVWFATNVWRLTHPNISSIQQQWRSTGLCPPMCPPKCCVYKAQLTRYQISNLLTVKNNVHFFSLKRFGIIKIIKHNYKDR